MIREVKPLRLIYLSLLTILYSQDSLDVDLDLDRLWEEALHHLYYRKSMKGIALLDLKKAYGKLYNKRETIKDPQELKKIDSYLNYLKNKIKNS
jgi:hypothetical protein